jgi:hypothetical protein
MDGHSDDQSRANSDRRVAMAAGAAGPAMGGNRGGSQRGGGKDDSSDSESTTDMEIKRKKLRAANPYPMYADANPYGAAVPPPPIGVPPGARY